MALRNHFTTFFVDDIVHHFFHNFAEGAKIFFVQINFMLFVMERPVIVGKFFAFGDSEVIISGLGAPYVKKVGFFFLLLRLSNKSLPDPLYLSGPYGIVYLVLMMNYVTKNVKKKLIQQLFYDSLPES